MGILNQLGIGKVVNTQQIAQTGSGLLNSIVVFLVFLLVVGVAGVIAWIVLRNLKYKNKIEIYKKVNGRVERIGKDKAIEFRYNRMGDSCFLLQKRKKYLITPTKQMGRNLYWYYIRDDGEWINIDISDIDELMRQMNVHFVDSDLRLARTAMYKNLKDRYDKPKFMEKYGTMIVNFVAIAIIIIGVIAVVNQVVKAGQALNAGIDSQNKVMDKATQILSSLDNICSGSKITTVPISTGGS